jgi:hypothetical protein
MYVRRWPAGGRHNKAMLAGHKALRGDAGRHKRRHSLILIDVCRHGWRRRVDRTKARCAARQSSKILDDQFGPLVMKPIVSDMATQCAAKLSGGSDMRSSNRICRSWWRGDRTSGQPRHEINWLRGRHLTSRFLFKAFPHEDKKVSEKNKTSFHHTATKVTHEHNAN